MSNKVTLNDLKNAYFELDEPKLINYCTKLLKEYFLRKKINEIQIETNITKMKNETIYSFNITLLKSKVKVQFVFTKEDDTQKLENNSLIHEKIIPNIYLSSNDLDVSAYCPNNEYIICLVDPDPDLILFAIEFKSSEEEMKNMQCSNMFEIAFNILIGRDINSRIH